MAKNLKIIILLLFPFLTKANDFELSPNVQKAYTDVFNFKVNACRAALAKEKKDNPFRLYLENYIEFVEIFNNDEEAYFKRIADNEDERLDLIEDLDENSPYSRFLRAEIKLQWALLKIRFGHEVKAAYNIIQAAKLLEENQKLFPNFLPNYKSLGSLHIVIGSVPDNFRWALKILGLKGNVNQGLTELDKATKDKIWGAEAAYCSLYIQSFVLKFDEKDNSSLLRFIENQPENPNASFIAVAISLRTNRAEQAQKILKKYPVGSEYLYCPIMEIYRGDIALMKGQFQAANASYNAYLRNFKGKAFLKDAYLKLFFSNYLAGDDKKSLTFLTKIPAVGNSTSETDKAAEKFYENYAKTHILPNKALLKARLSLDGGYSTQALDAIQDVDVKQISPKEQAEYYFLGGKAFYRTGQPDKAITYFEKSITLSEKQNWHFGASSSLQIGYILQAKGQKQQAKNYFEKAISYKNHEFKNTIDSKARAAMTEMGYYL